MKKFYNFLPLIILVALILAISAAIYNSSTKDTISNNNLSQNTIKLLEFSLPALFEAKNFSLKNLKNDQNRYSVVNFFASWCTTCLSEHEVLMQLRREKSINIYGVAWHDFKNDTIEFLEKNGNPYDITALDSQGLFTKIIGIKAVPETILVDSLGQVVLRYKGNLDEQTVFEILNFINAKR